MIERTLQTAAQTRMALFLHGSPTIRNGFFEKQRKRFGLELRSQGRGDLGARMHRAFEQALKAYRFAVLIGSDCPALAPADLRAAVRALRDGMDAVLLPAEDGGYALIGLRRSSRRLFAGVGWGGAGVLAQTRRRLERLGWRWKELRTVWDVDRPEDVARLRREKLL